MPPHPDHLYWLDFSFVFYGLRHPESVESTTLKLLTDFCDHHPLEVTMPLFGLLPTMDPHDPIWCDRVDHIEELALLIPPEDTTHTLTQCVDALFTLQALRLSAKAMLSHKLQLDYGTTKERV